VGMTYMHIEKIPLPPEPDGGAGDLGSRPG
jgi:hypothetical protein